MRLPMAALCASHLTKLKNTERPISKEAIRYSKSGPMVGEGAVVSESMVGISVFMNLSSPVLNLKHIMVKA
jgi:hypothetical protein